MVYSLFVPAFQEKEISQLKAHPGRCQLVANVLQMMPGFFQAAFHSICRPGELIDTGESSERCRHCPSGPGPSPARRGSFDSIPPPRHSCPLSGRALPGSRAHRPGRNDHRHQANAKPWNSTAPLLESSPCRQLARPKFIRTEHIRDGLLPSSRASKANS